MKKILTVTFAIGIILFFTGLVQSNFSIDIEEITNQYFGINALPADLETLPAEQKLVKQYSDVSNINELVIDSQATQIILNKTDKSDITIKLYGDNLDRFEFSQTDQQLKVSKPEQVLKFDVSAIGTEIMASREAYKNVVVIEAPQSVIEKVTVAGFGNTLDPNEIAINELTIEGYNQKINIKAPDMKSIKSYASNSYIQIKSADQINTIENLEIGGSYSGVELIGINVNNINLFGDSITFNADNVTSKELAATLPYSMLDLENVTVESLKIENDSTTVQIESSNITDLKYNAQYGSLEIDDATQLKNITFDTENDFMDVDALGLKSIKGKSYYSTLEFDLPESVDKYDYVLTVDPNDPSELIINDSLLTFDQAQKYENKDVENESGKIEITSYLSQISISN